MIFVIVKKYIVIVKNSIMHDITHIIQDNNLRLSIFA